MVLFHDNLRYQTELFLPIHFFYTILFLTVEKVTILSFTPLRKG